MVWGALSVENFVGVCIVMAFVSKNVEICEMTKKVSMTNICRRSEKRFRDREVARTLIHHESHKPNFSPFYVLFP